MEGELALKSPRGSKVSFVSWQTVSTPVTVPNENLFRTSNLGEVERVRNRERVGNKRVAKAKKPERN